MARYIDADKLLEQARPRGIADYIWEKSELYKLITSRPTEDGISKSDLLGWLLAYHAKSFELKGRYLPHEVIGWLVNDLSKDLLEDGEQNGTD